MFVIYRFLTLNFSMTQLLSHLVRFERIKTLVILGGKNVASQFETEEFNFKTLTRVLGFDRVLNCSSYSTLSPIEPHKIADFDLILISNQANSHFIPPETLLRAHLHGTPVLDLERFFDLTREAFDLEQLGWCAYLTTATQQTYGLRLYSALKPIFEPIFACLLLLLLAPLFLVISLVIRWFDEGPVFYSQVRTGYQGKPFRVHKFRTMKFNAEQNGPRWASTDDHRITQLGKWLRTLHLDELPQLWNVIQGEMSFVGPRPERPEFYEKLTQDIPLFHLRTLIRPGVTGWAQVRQGYVASVEESRRKLEYDLYYIQHQSPALDFMILLNTLWVSVPVETKRKQI